MIIFSNIWLQKLYIPLLVFDFLKDYLLWKAFSLICADAEIKLCLIYFNTLQGIFSVLLKLIYISVCQNLQCVIVCKALLCKILFMKRIQNKSKYFRVIKKKDHILYFFYLDVIMSLGDTYSKSLSCLSSQWAKI